MRRRKINGQRQADPFSHEALHHTGDDVFGGDILDCMAGRESAYEPTTNNGLGFRGMFQFGEAAWKDAFQGSSNPPAYLPNVFDPKTSALAAASYLNVLLVRIVGKDNYAHRNYADADKIEAIRRYNGSSISAIYAQQVWDCAQMLGGGDIDGAMAAIGKRP